MIQSVLVTGADGFVGRHLVRQLLSKGYYVRALDKNFRHSLDDGAERIQADILDHTLMAAAMEGVEKVFHLAAITSLWMPDETIYDAVNVEGTRCVLQAAIQAKVERFVHCSSFVTTIYGDRQRKTVSEKDICLPDQLLGAYAKSKRRAEQRVQEASHCLETVIVMPSAPIGAGDYNLTAPSIFLRDLVNGNIPATINQVTNFVDVHRLAGAIIQAGEEGEAGQRYLLTGKNRPMRQFLQELEVASGVKMPRIQVPYALAAIVSFIEEKGLSPLTQKPPKAPFAGVRMAVRQIEFDSAKAMNELGINLYPLSEALSEALLWLKKEGHITRPLPALENPQE